jgi:hypothetical protein
MRELDGEHIHKTAPHRTSTRLRNIICLTPSFRAIAPPPRQISDFRTLWMQVQVSDQQEGGAGVGEEKGRKEEEVKVAVADHHNPKCKSRINNPK